VPLALCPGSESSFYWRSIAMDCAAAVWLLSNILPEWCWLFCMVVVLQSMREQGPLIKNATKVTITSWELNNIQTWEKTILAGLTVRLGVRLHSCTCRARAAWECVACIPNWSKLRTADGAHGSFYLLILTNDPPPHACTRCEFLFTRTGCSLLLYFDLYY